jgi:Fic family protein
LKNLTLIDLTECDIMKDEIESKDIEKQIFSLFPNLFYFNGYNKEGDSVMSSEDDEEMEGEEYEDEEFEDDDNKGETNQKRGPNTLEVNNDEEMEEYEDEEMEEGEEGEEFEEEEDDEQAE